MARARSTACGTTEGSPQIDRPTPQTSSASKPSNARPRKRIPRRRPATGAASVTRLGSLCNKRLCLIMLRPSFPRRSIEAQIVLQMAVPIGLDMATGEDVELMWGACFRERGVEVGGWTAQPIAIADIEIDSELLSGQRLHIGVDAIERADRRAMRAERTEAAGVARREHKRPSRPIGDTTQRTVLALRLGAIGAVDMRDQLVMKVAREWRRIAS